ncbi:MAG: 30S ribosomal protein S12 methylthiotransferase RimO [Actinomycetota bacterium]|nr:30S ribosomal protein S12 methylthiotransferase RimO [Actinomycetota bacterium]
MSKVYIETLGCAKNEVDSRKLLGRALANGLQESTSADDADLIVVNTCAFIEAARQESIATILDLVDQRERGAKVVVTGCMATRYRDELIEALPDVDRVAVFGEEFLDLVEPSPTSTPIKLGAKRRAKGERKRESSVDFDLLNLASAKVEGPFAYLKVAEGCDRKCGFCAIPSFRGKQVSRSFEAILEEAESLEVPEIVLIAQDLASYGRDLYGKPMLVDLTKKLIATDRWIRLLYIYPSQLNDELIEVIGSSGLPYFDLSLQHVSKPLIKRMRRPGSGAEYLQKIEKIRSGYPDAVFRSNFIVGYPGETEEDHEALVDFIEEARLDWVGFFSYSNEEGTYSSTLGDQVDPLIVRDRLLEVSEVQERITRAKRIEAIGREVDVIVQRVGEARSYMESPEIDGIIQVDPSYQTSSKVRIRIDAVDGLDLKGIAI